MIYCHPLFQYRKEKQPTANHIYIKLINERCESKLYSHLCPKLLLRWHCLPIAMISFSTDNSEMPFWGWKSRLSLTLTMWNIQSDNSFSFPLYPLAMIGEAPWEQAQPAEQQVKSRKCRHLAIRSTSCLSWTHLWNKPLTSCYDPDNHCLNCKY